MYVFNGKLNFESYAENECATFVFPAAFGLMDTVCAFWQWTVDGNGVEKANLCQLGHIGAVTKKPTQYELTILFDYYFFDAVVESDFSSMQVTLRDPHSGATGPTCELKLQLSDRVQRPSIEVFTGKFNAVGYAQNEMVTLVVPFGISDGARVGLYFQWTVDGAGVQKSNHPVNGTLRSTSTREGAQEGSFDDGFYTYRLTVQPDRNGAVINMSGPDTVTGVAILQRCECRQSKRNKRIHDRSGPGTVFLPVRFNGNQH